MAGQQKAQSPPVAEANVPDPLRTHEILLFKIIHTCPQIFDGIFRRQLASAAIASSAPPSTSPDSRVPATAVKNTRRDKDPFFPPVSTITPPPPLLDPEIDS